MARGTPRTASADRARTTHGLARAIVRRIPSTMDAGITSAGLGKPDLDRARTQHDRYVDALRRCGLEVTFLDADARYPDSVFIEDTAVVTDRCAIVTNPGAESRKGEVPEVEAVLAGLCEKVERIVEPGTLDGGDVLQIGNHFYVGLTSRTNAEGAEQLATILQDHGFSASFVEPSGFLHLKTGVSYLGDKDLVVTGELTDAPAFDGFDKLVVSPEEAYGANCVRVNERVLVAAGYEGARDGISARGYEVVEVETSEFRKLDGGLSCLSLRLPAPEREQHRPPHGGSP